MTLFSKILAARTLCWGALATALTGCSLPLLGSAGYSGASRRIGWVGLAPSFGGFPGQSTVYSASECTGPVVNGTCHGSILPNRAYHQTCHGEMLFGQCTGPMF